MYQGDSAVIVQGDDMFLDAEYLKTLPGLSEEESSEKEENVPLDLLNEIIVGVFTRLEEV